MNEENISSKELKSARVRQSGFCRLPRTPNRYSNLHQKVRELIHIPLCRPDKWDVRACEGPFSWPWAFVPPDHTSAPALPHVRQIGFRTLYWSSGHRESTYAAHARACAEPFSGPSAFGARTIHPHVRSLTSGKQVFVRSTRVDAPRTTHAA